MNMWMQFNVMPRKVPKKVEQIIDNLFTDTYKLNNFVILSVLWYTICEIQGMINDDDECKQEK